MRKAVLELWDSAMEFIESAVVGQFVAVDVGDSTPYGDVQAMLMGLFQFGTDKDWVPMRCDPANLVYLQRGITDKDRQCYIDCKSARKSATECSLFYTHMNKVDPRGKGKINKLPTDVAKL